MGGAGCSSGQKCTRRALRTVSSRVLRVRGDGPHGEHARDPSTPVASGADRPADRVGGPQEGLVVAATMVVGGAQVVIDPGEGVGDGGPVPGPLGGDF
jgi:hypothetical protein